MTFDINAALKDCEGKDKIEERKDSGKVRNQIMKIGIIWILKK